MEQNDKIALINCFSNESHESKPMDLFTFCNMLIENKTIKIESNSIVNLTWSERTTPLTDSEKETFDRLLRK